MTDDTSYFICFDRYDMAYVAMLLLNSEPVQLFLMSVAFSDAKRPYTKKVLERISFKKMFSVIKITQLEQTEEKLKLNQYITDKMYKDFRNLPVFQEAEQINL